MNLEGHLNGPKGFLDQLNQLNQLDPECEKTP
jgi:hypothetical protein